MLLQSVLWLALVHAALAAEICAGLPFNDLPEDPPTSHCGSIVDQNLYAYPPKVWFNATDALDCLKSVPFVEDVAVRFFAYFNQTLQFHSTLAYLKDPPASYQQPPVDVPSRLQAIKDRLDSRCYNNQYAFEYDIKTIILAAHDSHLIWDAGILKQFTFGSPLDIVSVSADGREPPKVYLFDDVVRCSRSKDCASAASPIKKINGVSTISFLSEFAASQAFGLLEPHADWNQLMRTPALDVQAKYSTFGGNAPLYPGDKLEFELSNSTIIEARWQTLYEAPGYTGPIRTGGDFYNFFALDLKPKSYDYEGYYANYRVNITDVSASPGKNGQSDFESWSSSRQAYPDGTTDPKDTRLYDPDTLRGYTSKALDVAVLCIAGFAGDVGTFSEKFAGYLEKASERKTLIIDLQQNAGGSPAVALEAFRRLFPGVKPYTGSRMRSHDTADAIGQTMNDYFQAKDLSSPDYTKVIASEWVVVDRINAETGRNFSTWSEYFNGIEARDDNFTSIQQYDLTNEPFTRFNLGANYPPETFEPPARTPPWQASDIVLLTDGLCASACSLFVEMMTEAQGVKTIVVGGRPNPGPMQVASGTRGAAAYRSSELDADIAAASLINPQLPLPPRNNASRGFAIGYASINFRDQMRPNATVPNQFLNIPADCRLYWTFDNFYDYEKLWEDVLSAHQDRSMCVADSTNATKDIGKEQNVRELPKTPSKYASFALQIMKMFHTASIPATGELLEALNRIGVGDVDDIDPRQLERCGTDEATNSCSEGLYCQPFVTGCSRDCEYDTDFGLWFCENEPEYYYEYLCMDQCNTDNGCKRAHTRCRGTQYVDGDADKADAELSPKSERTSMFGYCYPRRRDADLVRCENLESSSRGNFIQRYYT